MISDGYVHSPQRRTGKCYVVVTGKSGWKEISQVSEASRFQVSVRRFKGSAFKGSEVNTWWSELGWAQVEANRLETRTFKPLNPEPGTFDIRKAAPSWHRLFGFVSNMDKDACLDSLRHLISIEWPPHVRRPWDLWTGSWPSEPHFHIWLMRLWHLPDNRKLLW